MAVILGTAGHIDHGKTTLVAALTGIDCDRLLEEKRRGITIDLGFAWLDLAGGDRLGIIDVPGHERFVRNMVAGAQGIDFVMLVIAADEGVMPQTREHVEICQLLGIDHGFVCVTKSDLVDADWRALVQEDIVKSLKGTFLEKSPLFFVSAQSGEGIAELKAYITKEAQQIPERKGTDLFRLPIDRVFTIKGHGTVVTGTVLSGKLALGDEVEIMPGGLASRVRSLERHEQSVSLITEGSRCAINLQGIETSEVHRGEIVAHKGTLFPQKKWFVRLTALDSSPIKLKQRTEVHFHHTTKELSARLLFHDRIVLAAGESAFCEVHLESELCGVFGDKCVIRSCSPLRTIAGATLLCPIPPRRPKKDVPFERYMALAPLYGEALKNSGEERSRFLREIIDLAGERGASFAELQVLSALPKKILEDGLRLLCSKRTIILYDKDARLYVSETHFLSLYEKLLSRARMLHEKAPLKASFARNALMGEWSQGIGEKLLQKLLDYALGQGTIVPEGDGIRLQSHTVTLAVDSMRLRTQILEFHQKAGLAPPSYKDVIEQIGANEKEAAKIVQLLVNEGELIRVKEGLYYAKKPMEDVLSRVHTYFESHESIDLAGLKSIVGLSRKYLVALLEYMDNAHITVRVGDKRILRKT